MAGNRLHFKFLRSEELNASQVQAVHSRHGEGYILSTVKQSGQVRQFSPEALAEVGQGNLVKQQVADLFVCICSASEGAILIQLYFIVGY